MYDFLIVGAGLTAATICAKLKHKYKILVVDVRSHIAGNCYDFDSGGTFLHKYGPHIFHSPDTEVVNFLSNYTEWIPYVHKVTAELGNGSRVPFPYSQETANTMGKNLPESEIIDIFFKPYSLKMWGVEWDELSPIIKNRVPKNTNLTSDYFINQFTSLPKLGYTEMIKKMMYGVDVILGVEPDYWKTIPAIKIIYCGRPDRIKNKNETCLGDIDNNWLTYRNLEFKFISEKWDANTPVVNFCHLKSPFTRKTFLPIILGGTSSIVTYETPIKALQSDISPFYFYPSENNTEKHNKLKNMIKEDYPNLILAGRLGTSTYIDMWQCVKMGIEISKKLN